MDSNTENPLLHLYFVGYWLCLHLEVSGFQVWNWGSWSNYCCFFIQHNRYRYNFIFSCHGHPVSSEPFVKNAVFFFIYAFGILVKDQMAVLIHKYVWGFYFVTVVNMSIFVPGTFFSNYHSTIIYLESGMVILIALFFCSRVLWLYGVFFGFIWILGHSFLFLWVMS